MLQTSTIDRSEDGKRAILAGVLACPRCQGDLQARPDLYRCRSCGSVYPVRDGIARFVAELSSGERQVQRSFDLEHARHLDSRYLHFTPSLVQQWLDDIKLPPEWFRGKTVLDAGCGSGRWTYAMASLGATVIAADLTNAGVMVTSQGTKEFERAAVVQANVLRLPFRPESFDLVVSWGVLHHTPDTREAFKRIAPLVKHGGQLYVMVYERHNMVKFLVTNILRWLLRRLPAGLRYRACRTLMVGHRRIYYRLSKIMICALYPESGDPLEVTTTQLGLYDAYSPAYNHLHTPQEVAAWFRERGFHEVVQTNPVRNSTPSEKFYYGEFGGSVNMRGVRA